MKKLYLLALCATTIALSGCASTGVPIHATDYTPNITAPKNPIKATAFGLQVKDLRGGDVNSIDVVKSSVDTQYGTITTFHNLELDEPMTQYVQDALSKGLKKEGFTVSDTSRYQLTAELLQTHLTIDPGFTRATFTLKCSVNMRLLDTKTNQVIWKSQFNATGIVKSQASFFKNQTVPTTNAVMGSAMDNLVTELTQDKAFLSYLK